MANYLIKRGDTLSGIAARYHTSVGALARRPLSARGKAPEEAGAAATAAAARPGVHPAGLTAGSVEAAGVEAAGVATVNGAGEAFSAVVSAEGVVVLALLGLGPRRLVMRRYPSDPGDLPPYQKSARAAL